MTFDIISWRVVNKATIGKFNTYMGTCMQFPTIQQKKKKKREREYLPKGKRANNILKQSETNFRK